MLVGLNNNYTKKKKNFLDPCRREPVLQACVVYVHVLCLGSVHTNGKIHILAIPKLRMFLKTSFP